MAGHATLEPRPLPPFDDWSVQAFDARLGFAWYCDPAALVIQSSVPHGSLWAVEALNDLIDRVLAARTGEVKAAGGLLLFHDWRSLRSYEKTARARQFERMKARPAGYARRTVIVLAPTNRLLRMAVETAGLFATMTFGSKVELATAADAALGRSGVKRPEAGAAFP